MATIYGVLNASTSHN